MKGLFITFEGGEGAGKSTQAKMLQEALTNKGFEVVRTREPGGTDSAEEIRQLLVTGDPGKWLSETELLLHFAARVEHLSKLVKPLLNKGTIVISDRFVDSTYAYQAYGHNLGTNLVKMLENIFISNFKPDLTFIMDIEVDKGIKRTKRRGDSEDRYEQMDREFHNRVRQYFLDAAKRDPLRCATIDATQSIEAIHNIVLDKVSALTP